MTPDDTLTTDQLLHIADCCADLAEDAWAEKRMLAGNAFASLAYAAAAVIELVNHDLIGYVCTEGEAPKPHLSIVKEPPEDEGA